MCQISNGGRFSDERLDFGEFLDDNIVRFINLLTYLLTYLLLYSHKSW